jgi:chromosome segregation ATPase
MVKEKEQKPLRAELVRSQLELGELERKNKVLETLREQTARLEEEISKLNEEIDTIKTEREQAESNLQRQIQEKEVQMKNDNEDYTEKVKKLTEDLENKKQKCAEIAQILESQLVSIKETRAKTEVVRSELEKLNEEHEAEKEIHLKEIEEVNRAADELLKLAQDPEAIKALEQMPEFLIFPEDVVEEVQEDGPPSRKKGKKKKKGKGKKK